jgi:predicted ATPase
MYKSIRIRNFRGIKDLEINDLGRVNLIVGANNVGKTSLLEAIYLLKGIDQPSRVSELANTRGLPSGRSNLQRIWQDLFLKEDAVDGIEISGSTFAGTMDLLRIRQDYEEFSPFIDRLQARLPLELPDEAGEYGSGSPVLRFEFSDSLGTHIVSQQDARGSSSMVLGEKRSYQTTAFVSSAKYVVHTQMAKWFTTVDDLGKLDEVTKRMKGMFPSIERLSIGIGSDDRPVIRAKLGIRNQPVLFYLFGDGAKRLLSLLLAIYSADSDVVLIDEIENGVFHEGLVDVWTGLHSASTESGVQVFATTHSWECVLAATRAFEDSPDDFRLHRLERRGDDLVAITAKTEQVAGAAAYGFDVR